MTGGVLTGTISKRDKVRSWIEAQGMTPITFDDVVKQYNLISGRKCYWASDEAKRMLAETHFRLSDGDWIPYEDTASDLIWNTETQSQQQKTQQQKTQTQSLQAQPTSAKHEMDFSSWDHPLLLSAISAWNALKATPQGHPDHLTVDFRNSVWMNIYSKATIEVGAAANPIDCAAVIAITIANFSANLKCKI